MVAGASRTKKGCRFCCWNCKLYHLQKQTDRQALSLPCILVTFDVSQVEMSPLKTAAPSIKQNLERYTKVWGHSTGSSKLNDDYHKSRNLQNICSISSKEEVSQFSMPFPLNWAALLNMFFIDFTCFGFHEAKPPSNAVAPTIRGKIIVNEEIVKDQQDERSHIPYSLLTKHERHVCYSPHIPV